MEQEKRKTFTFDLVVRKFGWEDEEYCERYELKIDVMAWVDNEGNIQIKALEPWEPTHCGQPTLDIGLEFDDGQNET